MQFLKNINVSLGCWFGIPITLHWSLIIVLLVIWFLSSFLFVVFSSLCLIVILHELGHCWAGKKCGAMVDSIVIYPIGGVANMEVPIDPKKEIMVALAGPAVNLALVPMLWCFHSYSNVMFFVSLNNLVMLVFNMLPAYPMDGGRVLRSVLCLFLKDHLRATEIAVTISKIISVLMFFVGLVFGQWVLSFIALFIYFMGDGELEQLRQKREFENEAIRTVLSVQEELDRLDENRM